MRFHAIPLITMKHSRLSVILALGLVAGVAHAQYAAPRQDAMSAPSTNWEVEAGIGYIASTNVNNVDNGWDGHIAAFYLDPLDSTRETTLKYGFEFLHGDASGSGDTSLETNFGYVDMGVDYRFSRHFGVGLTGGVGMGGLKAEVGGFSDSTAAFGYQLRPEIIGYINERVGVSLAYRFSQAFPLDSEWTKNPVQHALELSVKVRF